MAPMTRPLGGLVRLAQPLVWVRVEQPPRGDQRALRVQHETEPWLIGHIDLAACDKFGPDV